MHKHYQIVRDLSLIHICFYLTIFYGFGLSLVSVLKIDFEIYSFPFLNMLHILIIII
jgi:hypothetical protein